VVDGSIPFEEERDRNRWRNSGARLIAAIIGAKGNRNTPIVHIGIVVSHCKQALANQEVLERLNIGREYFDAIDNPQAVENFPPVYCTDFGDGPSRDILTFINGVA